MLEGKPELASFTFFNYSMNVMHYAAGTQIELQPAAVLHNVTCKWGRQTVALPVCYKYMPVLIYIWDSAAVCIDERACARMVEQALCCGSFSRRV